ncbi:MerR family transcriptional regulator [Methylocella silvestris]|uniref:MerR family transcriptional regulator n=1 Tax=Methylocella silvestris TaxID=199596 RepID=A0A2J7TJJ5_METSI|nr:MerR family transcriptional regulator [Methylocella silvestris]PNG26944.1 MerR family transcriptional regulator [Methylocella silvestris]
MHTHLERDPRGRANIAIGEDHRAASSGERFSQSSAPAPASTIREMARDFGVSIRALRFYEDRGLLRPKREGAMRFYEERERRNLKMILKSKQLGFTLAEISAMLASQSELLEAAELEMALPPEQIIAQIGFLERQRQELDAAIMELRKAHCRLVETKFLGAIA